MSEPATCSRSPFEHAMWVTTVTFSGSSTIFIATPRNSRRRGGRRARLQVWIVWRKSFSRTATRVSRNMLRNIGISPLSFRATDLRSTGTYLQKKCSRMRARTMRILRPMPRTRNGGDVARRHLDIKVSPCYLPCRGHQRSNILLGGRRLGGGSWLRGRSGSRLGGGGGGGGGGWGWFGGGVGSGRLPALPRFALL